LQERLNPNTWNDRKKKKKLNSSGALSTKSLWTSNPSSI